jgi:NADP-dependent 3-hydroxy acid dehydrogenase YdfG
MRFLIYGATKGQGDGIGHACAITLQARGHQVHGLCRDATKAAAETTFPLEALDIHDAAGQERLKALLREHDPDVVWSACGAGYAGPLWALKDDEVEQMIDANVRATVALCRACAPSCVDGGPHLVLTGSVAGVLDGTGAAVYSGAKGFLLPFVRAQRSEFRRQGHHARISALILSPVRTTGLDVVVEALEFIGRQSRSVELLIA